MSVAAPQRDHALAEIAPRLDPLIRRLATDHDGERLATVAAIERTLRAHGLDWHHLADLVGDGLAARELLQGDTARILYCLAHAPLLTDWERDFCRSLLGFRRLSEKQIAVLDRLVAKVQEGGR
jgi:hypothetical protein